MRGNPIRAAVERGEAQIGTWVNLVRNPAILPLLKAAGLDFARVDMEHSGPSIETVADMAVLARALDFPIVVRPPMANREWITRLLDLGVWNLHCPQVEFGRACGRNRQGLPLRARWGCAATAASAPARTTRQAATRPNGGSSPTARSSSPSCWRPPAHSTNSTRSPPWTASTRSRSGRRTCPQDLGITDSPDRARILDEKRTLLVEAARRHGKTCAMMVGSAEQARQWKAAGVLLLSYSSDVEVLKRAYTGAIASITPEERRGAPPPYLTLGPRKGTRPLDPTTSIPRGAAQAPRSWDLGRCPGGPAD